MESSLETDNEGPFGMGRHESKNVKIIYNPAKNKSKSLGRVGPTADQFNQLLSKEAHGQADSQTNMKQRKGSLLMGGMNAFGY